MKTHTSKQKVNGAVLNSIKNVTYINKNKHLTPLVTELLEAANKRRVKCNLEFTKANVIDEYICYMAYLRGSKYVVKAYIDIHNNYTSAIQSKKELLENLDYVKGYNQNCTIYFLEEMEYTPIIQKLTLSMSNPSNQPLPKEIAMRIEKKAHKNKEI